MNVKTDSRKSVLITVGEYKAQKAAAKAAKVAQAAKGKAA